MLKNILHLKFELPSAFFACVEEKRSLWVDKFLNFKIEVSNTHNNILFQAKEPKIFRFHFLNRSTCNFNYSFREITQL